MGRAIMGPQATGGFQAPEPYVPESAKAAGALYEAGLAPPVIEAAMQSQISHPADYSKIDYRTPMFSDLNREKVSPSMSIPQATTYNLPGTIGSSIPIPTAAEPAPFDPVAYRNQFKPDSGGLASVAQPTPPPQEITLFNESSVQPKGYETGGPTVEFLPQRGGPASRGQQMPSFYQQPMPMMPQPFNPMGYGPMGMGMNRFMNPYGGLGGMAYNFMNRPMPLYGQGGQFTAGQYQAPEPTTPTQPSFGFSPYGGFGYF